MVRHIGAMSEKKVLLLWRAIKRSANKANLRWSQLVKIQRIRVVRLMYVWLIVVPILAKAFSGLEEAARVEVFGYKFQVQLSLPFSWNVFYFSALSFAAANLIFILRSYSLIKDHVDFLDFARKGKSEPQLARYAEEGGMAWDDLHISYDNLSREARLKGGHLKEPFWRAYEQLDLKRPRSRFLCTALYFVGFLLIGIVFVQNFAAVWRLVFS